MMSTAKPVTNFLELPSDIMANILHRVSVMDIFENIQKVCTKWYKICKEPAMWRVIKMDSFPYSNEMSRLKEICKLAVDRSQGQLVDLTIVDFADDELLQYVADSELRRLELAFCLHTAYGNWSEYLKKFPLLEELNLYSTVISIEAIETAGRYCPMLKTLRVNHRRLWVIEPALAELFTVTGNSLAKAIGGNLFDLRHLELIGHSMSNVGLQLILDGCRHLESLDLRNCWNIDLNKDLMKRCSEQIKHLKLPDDSLEDYPYIFL